MERRGEKTAGWRGGRQNAEAPAGSVDLKDNPALWSALRLPAQSQSNPGSSFQRAEDASSNQITYAVRRGDMVWITLSVTPESLCHRTLGLLGDGCYYIWIPEMRHEGSQWNLTEWRLRFLHVWCYLAPSVTRCRVIFTVCQASKNSQLITDLFPFLIVSHPSEKNSHKLDIFHAFQSPDNVN